MENKAHAIAAGIFTMVLGIAVLLAALWFTGDTYEKSYYVLESKYPVTGLYEQAAVRFRGVDVGKVTLLRFDPDDKRRILIYVGVVATTPVTKGTYAEIRPQGVTGLSYVMLDDMGRNPEPLPPATERNSARIAVKPTLLENILSASEEALGDVRQVAQRLSAILSDENRKAIGKTLASLQNASDRLGALAQAAEPGAKNVGPLVSDARKTLQQLDGVLAELSGTAKQLANRMEAIDRVANSTEKTSNSIGQLAESVNNESLPRINLLVEELTRTTRGLDRFVEEIKDQPQSLVFGRKAGAPGPGEPGFVSAREKGSR